MCYNGHIETNKSSSMKGAVAMDIKETYEKLNEKNREYIFNLATALLASQPSSLEAEPDDQE